MAAHFTVREAERLLPEVKRAIRQAIARKAEYQQAQTELDGYLRRLAQLGGALADRQTVSALKSSAEQCAEGLRSAIEEIGQYGCEVKDLDIGLIDFRTYYRGTEVYLCWKLGEDGISWWHGLEDGFRGRRPIDEDFLEHHHGDHRQ